MTVWKTALALGPAAALALGGCSSSDEPGQAPQASASIVEALGNAEGMHAVTEALDKTGLDSVFEGKASYTLLAPSDSAFKALGQDAVRELTESPDHAAIAALLRDHILPGYVTPEDISRAIDQSGEGKVQMRTMDGDELTFARSGSAIVVTGPDGVQATLGSQALTGGGSSAIALDRVLKKA